ncbi:lytic transglycosylase domain-containing protein [Novosphingobium sp. ST904]|uniref:lytic transglycosylase domain-containing protein n=1 Tax=Novosphingobium sp. ST904 TaxID=1684385 RepID=UPI0010486DC6|nr:lytic transglycosylase domain-containing protein [Novosphingobium sp. ST904]
MIGTGNMAGPAANGVSSPVMRAGAGEAAPAPAPSPLPEGFSVHDLSRRYVEYRMARAFLLGAITGEAEPQNPSDRAPEPVATSSIAVPGWMRGAWPGLGPAPFAPAATPGCVPLPYRPAGFLKPAAEARRASYYGMMSTIACEQGIPVGLFDAMIIQESRYDPYAISPKRAFGLAQLMPGTAQDLGVNAYDPAQNLRGGARYLRNHLDRFGQVHLALAAYNAGPGRVRGGAVPRIAETQGYVATILGNWARLNSGGAVQARSSQVNAPYGPTVSVSSY